MCGEEGYAVAHAWPAGTAGVDALGQGLEIETSELVGHVGDEVGHLEHLSIGHAVFSLGDLPTYAGGPVQRTAWWSGNENRTVDASSRCGYGEHVAILLKIAILHQSWVIDHCDTVVVLLTKAGFDALLETGCSYSAVQAI